MGCERVGRDLLNRARPRARVQDAARGQEPNVVSSQGDHVGRAPCPTRVLGEVWDRNQLPFTRSLAPPELPRGSASSPVFLVTTQTTVPAAERALRCEGAPASRDRKLARLGHRVLRLSSCPNSGRARVSSGSARVRTAAARLEGHFGGAGEELWQDQSPAILGMPRSVKESSPQKTNPPD